MTHKLKKIKFFNSHLRKLIFLEFFSIIYLFKMIKYKSVFLIIIFSLFLNLFTINANGNNNNVNNNIVNIHNVNTNDNINSIFKPKSDESDDMSLIVSLLDGSIYSFQYNNGKLRWDISGGKSLYETSQVRPQYSLEQSDEDLDSEVDDYIYHYKKQERINRIQEDESSLFIPNIDGSGEFYQYQSGSIQKLPFTIHDIVQSSHFLYNNNDFKKKSSTTSGKTEIKDDNVLYIGTKSTSVLMVDSNTGEILKSLSDDGVWQSGCPSDIPKDTLLFTRSDYKVLALDPKSGSEKWNLSIGEYTPYSTEQSHFSADTLIFEGSIEVLPNSNNNQGYKLFVQKKKTTANYWEVVLPSAPVNIYAHSSSKNILKKLSFNRRLSSQVTSLLPYYTKSTDLMIPAQNEPTFIFDSFDGNFFITSNERDLTKKNQSPNSPNIMITDGNSDNSSTNTISNGNGGSSNNSNSNNNSYSQVQLSHIMEPMTLINDIQIKILLLILIFILLSKRVKGWYNLYRENTMSSKKPLPITPKKTPKKKKKNQKINYIEEINNEDQEEGETIEEFIETSSLSTTTVLIEKDEVITTSIIDTPTPNQPQPEQQQQPVVSSTVTTSIHTTKKVILDNGNIRIGKLEITNKVLGTGSCGTVVFKGYLDGRKVAIKKMLSQFMKFADREVSILLHSDEHMNVVRYYAKEEDQEFIYLALSFCKFTLDSYVNQYVKPQQNSSSTNSPVNTNKVGHSTPPPPPGLTPVVIITPQMKQMIYELLQGLSHLHSLNIVHRDIKPQNILVDPNNRIKISDMGLGKLLDIDDASLTFNSEGHGWQPAEYLNGTNKNTKKVDIFSMGCVIYYLITGLNPFGTRFNREKNVLKGKYDIELVTANPNLHQLIQTMIHSDPDKRPTVQECLEHPFFWNTHKRISFLASSSDYLEFEKPTSPLNVEIDSHIEEVAVGGDWWLYMDKILIDNIGRYRKYNGKSIRDLLRVIRNKFNHYRDLSPEEKICLGNLPDGFLSYFEKKFPKLLIITYLFVHKNLKNEAYFKQYYVEDDIPNTTTASTTSTTNVNK
ncbi:putative protein serine/threonine kinase [Tieghemostelium lacteum]|uniref:non-specific serine/threonine protein kinase n=1 Tax=Tieghemostelium lacteum TaxID=361077 RepID=A0A151Z5U1_TIELA|nr:putative protein serine/threonine kinase [Tieghemostelium lacteum]|eukprot:KYQ89321.1 putative protein serine/threonine kinase [Tieghemostelium lacteum]